MKEFIKITPYISTLASVLTVAIAAVRYKRLPNFALPLFILVIIAGSVELINALYIEMSWNNFFIFRLFTVVEFFLISQLYYRFFKQYFNALVIQLILPLFLLIAFVDYRMHGLDSMDSFPVSVESVICSIYSLFLFYFVLRNLLFENLMITPIFWFNVGVLFYFSGNLILFIFSNYSIESSAIEHAILWSTIHAFFNIMYNVFLSIGFWKTRRT